MDGMVSRPMGVPAASWWPPLSVGPTGPVPRASSLRSWLNRETWAECCSSPLIQVNWSTMPIASTARTMRADRTKKATDEVGTATRAPDIEGWDSGPGAGMAS